MNQHYICVKSGKNANDACAMLSKTCGGEAVKSQVFLSCINGLHVKITSEVGAYHFL
jgi:hypothetical protein